MVNNPPAKGARRRSPRAPSKGKLKSTSPSTCKSPKSKDPTTGTPNTLSPPLLTTTGINEANTPLMANGNAAAFELEDPNETVKSSEKPPEPTYKSKLIDGIDIHPLHMSTFLLHKMLYEEKSSQSDDDTVDHDNSKSTHKFNNSIRMTMMFKLPTKKEGCSDDNAPKIAIQKMNTMLRTLSNKLPCRVGPWTLIRPTSSVKDQDLYKTLPEDIDFVESYVFDYNRFLSPGKTGYVRLHIFYSDSTSVSEIQGVVSQFKKPREQFLEMAHSNAISPVVIGTLTGSVKAMAESRDFYSVMKKKFGLSELGLWFTQPRTSRSGDYSKDKFTLHIEIDRKDLPKREEIERYFNHSPPGLDHTFFGTSMLLVKAFDYFADDDVKEHIDNHARKQTSLGSSLRSTVVTGVQLCNWSDSDRTSTLHKSLMDVQSIVEKTVVKGEKTTKFKGRVFYAIIPNKNSYTFYYTRANSDEGRSIARGLPLFIRDYFKLDPAFFCTSDAITSALAGDWDYESRKFLSAAEKIEADKLDLMEIEALADHDPFISKDQQLALALSSDDVSEETRLTKGDAAPPTYSCDISDMTGSTRESKAKAYADKAVKEVASQYNVTISTMKSDIGAKDDKIAQLELMLAQLKESSGDIIDVDKKDKRQNQLEEDSSTQTKKRKSTKVDITGESSHEDDMSL